MSVVKHALPGDVEQFLWEPLFGPGPYRFCGCTVEVYQACPGAPIQVGTCCDVCGQGIKNVAWWTSSTGRRFKTGLDCAAKSGRKEVVGAARKAKREHDRKVRNARNDRKRAELEELLGNGHVRELLASLPHPMASDADDWHRAFKSQTLLHSYEWTLINAGAKGRNAALKEIKELTND